MSSVICRGQHIPNEVFANVRYRIARGYTKRGFRKGAASQTRGFTIVSSSKLAILSAKRESAFVDGPAACGFLEWGQLLLGMLAVISYRSLTTRTGH